MKGKIVILSALMVLLITGATAQPEGQNPGFVPGDIFYPVEQAVEKIEVKVAGVIGGEDLKAKALANNADERVAEAQKLEKRNRSDRAEEVRREYNRTMDRAKEISEQSSDQNLGNEIQQVEKRNREVLKDLKDRAPPQAQKGLENALNRSERDNGEKVPGAENGSPLDNANQENIPENLPSINNSTSVTVTGNKTDLPGPEPAHNRTNNSIKDHMNETLDEENSTDRLNDTDEEEENLTNSITGSATGRENTNDEGSNRVEPDPEDENKGPVLNGQGY